LGKEFRQAFAVSAEKRPDRKDTNAAGIDKKEQENEGMVFAGQGHFRQVFAWCADRGPVKGKYDICGLDDMLNLG